MAEVFLSSSLLLVHSSEQRRKTLSRFEGRELEGSNQETCVVDRPRNRAEKGGGSRENGRSVLINRTNLRDTKPRALCRTALIDWGKPPRIAPACWDVKIQLMGPIPDRGRDSIEFDPS